MLKYFNLAHVHRPMFVVVVVVVFCDDPGIPNFFLALFLSFFSTLLFSLPFALHIPSNRRKNLGVNGGSNLIAYSDNGAFYHRFCSQN